MATGHCRADDPTFGITQRLCRDLVVLGSCSVLTPPAWIGRPWLTRLC